MQAESGLFLSLHYLRWGLLFSNSIMRAK